MSSEQDQRTKVQELLKDFRHAMLVTQTPENQLHARPMHVAQVDDNAHISFLTSIDSPKLDELRAESRVSVTMQSKGAFVAISGKARILTDEAEVERLFSLADRVWFDGPDDPQATAISVEPITVEYWDQRGLNGLKYAFGAVRAMATGEHPDTDARQHARVNYEG
jgi:general stress protein 26